MKLRTHATLFALRTTARLAWTLADLSRSLGALGERIESAVDTQALRLRVDLPEVLEPVIAKHLAS
jgi:hypothetical protein